jgi:hypothetical protein
MSNPPLIDQVRALAERAALAASTPSSKERCEGLVERLNEPLRVAIAGKVKAGKSTLLNALVGQQLAPTDAGECTRIVTWYRDGVTYHVTLFPNEGLPVEVPFDRNGHSLRVDLQGRRPEDAQRLVVDWPSASLKDMTLIDTPGIASVSTDIAARAQAFLVGEDEPSASDAVLYLMRHLHTTDVSFLEAFRDQQAAQTTPINAIGLLSRADEIGVGKIEAMATAERIAARYRSHPEVSRLCQTVLPVSALLAQAGVTLRQDQFASLASITSTPVEHEAALVLSTDRFRAGVGGIGLTPETREELLRDFGLFGIRISLALIRKGTATSAPKLASILVQLSGLPRLRAVLDSRFAARRDVLKARAALLALGSIVRDGEVEDAKSLAAELERIEAGAHEFAEIALLNALHTRAVVLPEDARADAERLLGADGADLHSRVGVAVDAPQETVEARLNEALGQWRIRAENPLASREAVTAARVLVRTTEGLLAALSTPSQAEH